MLNFTGLTRSDIASLAISYAEPAAFSRWEVVLFLVLALASLAGFFARFSHVLVRVYQSKKDADFKLFPLDRRVWDFIWEVMFQGKVIQQRPLPGIAHAFVFWGFCAFALVSLNHIATGAGFPFLTSTSWVGEFYFWFAAAFALVTAISIAGLFVRRLFVRPIWLGRKLSVESLFIAFLIFALMVTYLAAFDPRATPGEIKALWWAHTLALLVFLPLIPHTKHLHLVLSPVTVFLKRDGFSHIPPLVGDEDFGMVTGQDVTQLASLQAYSCVECGRCTEHCPAFNTGKVLNPKQVILGLRDYLNDAGPKSEEPLIGKHESLEALFQCTTCGSCEFQCPVGIQHLPLIIGMRRGAVNTGVWEDDHGTKLFLALEKNGNSLGLSSSERDKFVARQGFPIFDGTQEYCLWLGCMGGYDAQGRETIAAFARVMEYLGTSYGVMKKEKCTGDPARRLGNDLVFQTLVEENLRNLEQNKVKKIVAICPHCVRTIAEDWKEFGVAPQIEHHSEFMARHQAQLPNKSTGETIVYHDPCYLGRYRGVYDQPREVLAMSGTVIDPPRARERSFCCGAGGGMMFLGEEQGERVNHARAKELVDTGAQVIGVACPFCSTMFRDALGAKSDAQPKLLDIAQITAMQLPQKQADAAPAAQPLS